MHWRSTADENQGKRKGYGLRKGYGNRRTYSSLRRNRRNRRGLPLWHKASRPFVAPSFFVQFGCLHSLFGYNFAYNLINHSRTAALICIYHHQVES